jgi:hypothetical protein
VSASVRALARVAFRYDPEARAEKVRLLDALAAERFGRAGAVREYHELLCFLQAYPDDAALLARVDAELAAFSRRTTPVRGELRDSGIAGTRLDYPFGFPMARWLASAFPRDVQILWGDFDRADDLDEALSLALGVPESDALGEGGAGVVEWLPAARDGQGRTDLQVLLDRFERAAMPATVRDRLYDGLGVPLAWTLKRASRTSAKDAGAPVAYQRRPLQRRLANFVACVSQPLQLRRVPIERAEALCETFRVALAARLREVYALSYASPRDVWSADAGRGLGVVLVGIQPAYRLPIESLYAFLLVKNGVPIGYGTGTALGGAAEMATNIFPSFRPGESAWTFAQVLRVFRVALGVRTFIVDPYQLGHDNDEALRAGAVFFYHRQGFRSASPEVRALMREELCRIAARPGYRTPPSTLRRLAAADVILRLRGGPAPDERIRATRLGLAVAARIGRHFGGRPDLARRAAVRDVGRALRLVPSEPLARLAPILALIPDLAQWPASARRRAADVVRARESAETELPYARRLASHRRLVRALRAACV